MSYIIIVWKLKGNRLRLYGHFMRRYDFEAIRIVIKINVEGKKDEEYRRN